MVRHKTSTVVYQPQSDHNVRNYNALSFDASKLYHDASVCFESGFVLLVMAHSIIVRLVYFKSS